MNENACAAKQACEYFRNAKQADYSVRSLLTKQVADNAQ